RHPWAPVVPLILIAVFEAGLGLVQAAGDADVIGTYRSKNHFAGMLEMTLPLVAGFAIALAGSGGETRRQSAIGRTVAAVAGFAAAALLLSASINSLSKMGFVAA